MEAPHLPVEAELLREAVPPSAVVLEAGCGRRDSLADSLAPYRDRIREIIGVDLDAEAGGANPALDRFLAADLCDVLPLEESSIDLVYASFVVEHLADPAAAIAEWRRVLKPGGALLVVAPNLSNPLVWLGRALPHRLRAWLKRLGTGVEKRDVHRAHYRASRAQSLTALASRKGFVPVAVRHVATLHSYAGERPLLRGALTAIERALPARRRSTIVILFRSAEAPPSVEDGARPSG